MKKQQIYLHQDVKNLIGEILKLDTHQRTQTPEEYATLSTIHRGISTYDATLTSLIGDFYDDVTFYNTTNDAVRQKKTVKFQKPIQGSLIGVIAPDLNEEMFKQIFFDKPKKELLFENPDLEHLSWPNRLSFWQKHHYQHNITSQYWEIIKQFYGLDSPLPEDYIEMGQAGKFNAKAYSRHFKILFENIAEAAKRNNKSLVSIPGLGLGIFAGDAKQYKSELSTIQFNILKDIAAQYPDITFKYFGQSPNNVDHANKDNKYFLKTANVPNVKVFLFNDTRHNMLSEQDTRFLRAVAGGTKYDIGDGRGDNGRVGKHTNISSILTKLRSNDYKNHYSYDIQNTVPLTIPFNLNYTNNINNNIMNNTSNIFLHNKVEILMQNMGIRNPNQYAINLIKRKDQKISGGTQDPVLISLIGDSFNVEFRANTNNGGNATGHRKFAQPVKGTVMANVAPNLDMEIFQNIFFKQKNSNLNEHIKAFYGINHDSEYIKLPTTDLELNKTAYKKHFEIWAENNVAAAKLYGAKRLVIPGMGFHIYAGPLQGKRNDLKILADIQFEVLKEIAVKNQDLELIFCGLGQEPSQHEKVPSNLEGRLFTDLKPMIQEGKPNQIRVVAGSLDIPLGGGGGDNLQIAADTNAARVRRCIKNYKVLNVSKGINLINISNEYENESVSKEIDFSNNDMSLKYFSDTYKEAIEVLSTLKSTQDLTAIEKDYVQIKKVIRTLNDMKFSRFKDKPQFQGVIAAEKNFKDALKQAKNDARPSLKTISGIITICVEFCKDILSWVKRYFSAERKWSNSIKNDVESHKQIIKT